ncbi:MAG: recombinase family protein [Dehalococcoidales bacterium]|nr:recombinase family protein [Dehalococcoidales bacterium]
MYYNKKEKQFDHISDQIHVIKEILKRYIDGDSSSAITVDLQKRGIKSATGGKVHRSAVNRVLSHAQVYAGHLKWNGYIIPEKVKPIITDKDANIVAERLRRNKELSYGFGKRKPLTGRVFCGLCGRRYNLDANKGCRCNGSDPRNPIKCPAPKVSLKELTDIVYEAIFTAMMDDEALIKRTTELRELWERETAGIKEKLREKDVKLASFDKRRRLLSIQHELGGITSDEYLDRLSTIDKEKGEFTEQQTYLRKFTPME